MEMSLGYQYELPSYSKENRSRSRTLKMLADFSYNFSIDQFYTIAPAIET